ncbi:hypothetical protein NDU88_004283 [Pleurodeles waltl]|uniref:Uncharacterized protein n=1 Tax=Pleurodeles waltl TaxID=8319 RepID=A0AAV7T8P7_PLEWA|nr:hypothetical protein NDU88_004283 [Pleurodeles waltl]
MSLPGGSGSEPHRPVKKCNPHVAADRENVQMGVLTATLCAKLPSVSDAQGLGACPAPPGCCPDCLRGLLGAEEAYCACVCFPIAEEVAAKLCAKIPSYSDAQGLGACPATRGCCPDCLRGLLGAEEACYACVRFPSAEEVASIRSELSRGEPPSRISRAI